MTIGTLKEVSRKASQIEPSSTMAIAALAKALKDEGKDVLSFSAGEPDFPTPERISNAGIQSIKDGHTTYTAAPGMPSLKKSIAEKVKREHDLDYAPDEVIVSCGAKHSIYNALFALVNPGDEVIFQSPYWVSYPSQVQLVDGVSVIIDGQEANNFKITPDQLEAVVSPKSKVLILNSPSNPTGSVYSKAELEALSKVIIKHNLWVISDEIYAKLLYDNKTHCSIATLEGMKERTLLVDGASKAYSMTGWRIGYIAGPKAIISLMSRMQSHSTSNPTTPSQFAALEAFKAQEPEVEIMRQAFEKRRALIVSGLNDIPYLSCINPEGAFYAFPNVSGTFGKTCKSGTINNSVDFCEYLLKEAEVALVPGSAFGADDFVRMSYATSEEVIEAGLKRIREWVSTF